MCCCVAVGLFLRELNEPLGPRRQPPCSQTPIAQLRSPFFLDLSQAEAPPPGRPAGECRWRRCAAFVVLTCCSGHKSIKVTCHRPITNSQAGILLV